MSLNGKQFFYGMRGGTGADPLAGRLIERQELVGN
jgi:hypothetical protein